MIKTETTMNQNKRSRTFPIETSSRWNNAWTNKKIAEYFKCKLKNSIFA